MSANVYNTTSDYDKLAESIEQMMSLEDDLIFTHDSRGGSLFGESCVKSVLASVDRHRLVHNFDPEEDIRVDRRLKYRSIWK